MRLIHGTFFLAFTFIGTMACETSDDGGGDGGGVNDTSNSEGTGGDTPTEGGSTPTCAAYCEELFDNCTGEHAQYADEAECNSMCETYLTDPGNAGDNEGNTIGCRIYHAQAAASLGTTHCHHAGLFGGGTHATCGDICHVYCALIEENCSANPIDMGTDCMTKCAPLMVTNSDGELPADGGADLECHIYHLGVAASNPGTHCAHGQPGASVCSD